MIAEDFGPVVHNGHVRVLATKSITVEGARARTGPCVHGPCTHGAKRPARASRAKRERARPAQSAIGTIIDIAVKLVKPKSFLTPTSGLVRNAG